MAYLTLAALTVEILSDSGEATEPEVSGGDVRAFAGNLRSSRRWAKRQWRRVTKKLSPAEVTTLLATIGSPLGGNVVAVTGTIVNGVSTDCLVTVTGIDDVKESPTTIKHHVSLLLREV